MKVVTRVKCVLTYSTIESGNFESGHKSKGMFIETKAILKVVTRVKYVHRNKGNFESGHKSKVCS